MEDLGERSHAHHTATITVQAQLFVRLPCHPEHLDHPRPALEETWLGPPITHAIDDLAAELALASPLPGRDPEPGRLLFSELLVNALGHRSYEEAEISRPVEVRARDTLETVEFARPSQP
jgi:hypothetical protein